MKFERNANGVRYVTTTMRHVRRFDVWQDSLEVSDDTLVYVHEDGSVNDAMTGEAICFDIDASSDVVDAWKRFWGFR